MSLIRLIYGHIRRIIFQPKLLIMLILIPLAIITFNYVGTHSGMEREELGIIENQYSDEIKEIMGELAIYYPSKQDALDELEQMKVKSVCEVTEQGMLRYSYQDSEVLQSLDGLFSQKIQENRLRQAFEKEGLQYPTEESVTLHLMVKEEEAKDYMYIFTVSLMLYAIMLYSGTMAEDLINMQLSGVTERSVASPQNYIKLNLSFSLANLFLLLVVYTVLFFGTNKLMNFEMNNPLALLLATLLASFYSITFAQTAVRFLKTQSAASVATTLVGVLGFIGATFSYVEVVKLPSPLLLLAKVLPHYYLLDMLFTGRILMNVLILGLMILVVLTAGSYKFERFARR